MKKTITLSFLVLLLIINSAYFKANNSVAFPRGFNEQKSASISFLENKGQAHDQNNKPRPDVLFSGVNQGMVFHLRNNGVSYQLTKFDSVKKEATSSPLKTINSRKKGIHDRYELSERTSTIYRLDINWLNINTNSRIIKGKAYEGFNNYYTANCPNGLLNVKSFEDVTYTNIYNGIDLKWYQQNNQLKYDYIVSAGSDYRQIQFEIEGALDININAKGELEFKTPLGTIIEQAPLVTQDGKTLPSSWKVNKNKVSFDIQNINPNQSFIIDPPVRVWGTYYGGNSDEYGNFCATDASGDVFLTGSTTWVGGTIIATLGSHQAVKGGGIDEAFIVKFNSTGVRQWGTYYGGTGNDLGYSCCTDASGNVYMAGTTDSNSGIGSGGHSNVFNGGVSDAFLVKFNSVGVRQWATYYGAGSYDDGRSCATDASGNVYLTGITDDGSGSMATVGAHRTSVVGLQDGFLVKFNSAGIRQWGTYYGGDDDEYVYSCCTDASSNVYIAGYTLSSNFFFAFILNIATAGSHQSSQGGGYDAFLVQFNSSGVRQWGTYYGGTGDDFGYSCAADPVGNIYLAGGTNSSNSISTPSGHQTAFGGGFSDAFIVQFNSLGVMQWGSYYGGLGNDYGYCSFTDVAQNIYLVGGTTSSNGIATATAHQISFGGGASDAFLAQFNSSGTQLWATYYGGVDPDFGNSGCVDLSGNIYLGGTTEGAPANVISTPGSHQPIDGGGGQVDGFLVQFYDNTITLPVELTEFNAHLQNEKIYLDWTTQTEVNNDFFEVEKSVNGTNFEVIGKVKGNGNLRTFSTYNFIDEEPVDGINYYRLKQVDFNGVSKNSNVVQVNFDKETTRIYPNPANDYINIQPKNNLQKVSIKNLFGVEVVSKLISSSDYTIDLKALSEGFYIVNIDGKNQNLIIKK